MIFFAARLVVLLCGLTIYCTGFMRFPSAARVSLCVGVATDKDSTHISSSGGVPADWSPSSWRNYPIKQPPNYPDPAHVAEVEEKMRGFVYRRAVAIELSRHAASARVDTDAPGTRIL